MSPRSPRASAAAITSTSELHDGPSLKLPSASATAGAATCARDALALRRRLYSPVDRHEDDGPVWLVPADEPRAAQRVERMTTPTTKLMAAPAAWDFLSYLTSSAISQRVVVQLMRTWRAIQALAAQVVVLPVVCVTVCGLLGVLAGLECVEAVQRRRPTTSFARLMLLPLCWAVTSQRERPTAIERDPSFAGQPGRRVTWSRQPDQASKQTNSNAAAASRPLKRQKSSLQGETSAGNASSSSSMQQGVAGGGVPRSQIALQQRAAVLLPPLAKRRVFIWDLDETLLLFASLYTGSFARTHQKEIATGVVLGQQMMTFLIAMLERHFFFDDLHDADIDHITSLHEADDEDTASTTTTSSSSSNEAETPAKPSAEELKLRYAHIRAIYERLSAVDFLDDRESEWFAIREALVASIDHFSTGWLGEARQILQMIARESESSSGGGDLNVLVTNTQLAPALCKCLIYQLDSFFPIELVYSSSKLHKRRCFEAIMQKHAGPNVEFIAIGDGAEEEHVSRELGIAFHRVGSLADLKQLRYKLQLVQPPFPSIVRPEAVAALAQQQQQSDSDSRWATTSEC